MNEAVDVGGDFISSRRQRWGGLVSIFPRQEQAVQYVKWVGPCQVGGREEWWITNDPCPPRKTLVICVPAGWRRHIGQRKRRSPPLWPRSVVEVKQKKVRRTRIGVNAKSRVVLEFFFDVWAVSLSKQVLWSTHSFQNVPEYRSRWWISWNVSSNQLLSVRSPDLTMDWSNQSNGDRSIDGNGCGSLCQGKMEAVSTFYRNVVVFWTVWLALWDSFVFDFIVLAGCHFTTFVMPDTPAIGATWEPVVVFKKKKKLTIKRIEFSVVMDFRGGLH